MLLVRSEKPFRPAEPNLPRHRVVTAIAGGLGNQMFQYAMARRFAQVNQAELLLYFGARYKSGSYRVYGLNKFRTAGRVATEAEAGGLRRIKPMRRRLGRLFPSLLPPEDSELVKERDLRFNPDILSLRGSAKFAGYWQSERYFADIADVIREDFTLRNDLDRRSQETLKRIGRGPSCFIHVRRGDYLQEDFGTCSAQYYREAAELVRERAGDAVRFFVFSDDPAWVREAQVGGADAEVIDWNGETPERDLALMSRCRHAIVANSSFSWWGAWLGDDDARMVIAPRVWMKGRSDSADIVPERWSRL
jgi:hypothetical protein